MEKKTTPSPKGLAIIVKVSLIKNSFGSEGQVHYLKLQAVLVLLLGGRGNSMTKMEVVYVCVSLYH